MTRLEDVLERAAVQRPLGFEVADVRARVHRRRRARRGAGVLAGVLLIGGVVALASAVTDDDQRIDVAEGGSHVVGGVDVVGRWDLLGVSEVTVAGYEGVYLELRPDGSLDGFDGCNDLSAAWTSDGDRLVLGSPVEQTVRSCPHGADVGLVELLAAGPLVSSFGEWPDSLQLRTPDRFLLFTRDDGDPAGDAGLLSCDGGPGLMFTADALAAAPGAEQADDPAAAALREHLAEYGGPMDGGVDAGPVEGWRRIAETEDAVLFIAGEPPTPTMVVVGTDGSGWRFQGSGGCTIRPHRPGFGPANWAPAVTIGPGSTSFEVDVWELACTGGSSSADRIVGPEIDSREDAVVVGFWVEPLPSRVSTCPGNPPTRVTVELSEPLGGRMLLDGGTYPPREPTGH